MSMCAWRLFNPFGGVSVVLFNGIIQLMRLGFILGILRQLIVVAWEAINDVINDENTWVIRQTIARFDKCWHICTERLVRSFWPRPGFSYTTVDCLQLTFLCASAANPVKDKKKRRRRCWVSWPEQQKSIFTWFGGSVDRHDWFILFYLINNCN